MLEKKKSEMKGYHLPPYRQSVFALENEYLARQTDFYLDVFRPLSVIGK